MPRYILKASAVRKYICEVTARDEQDALNKACMQDLWKVEDEAGWQDDSCTEIKDEASFLNKVKDGVQSSKEREREIREEYKWGEARSLELVREEQDESLNQRKDG